MQRSDLEDIAKRICQRRRLLLVARVGEGTFKQTFQVLQTDGTPLALKLYKADSSAKRDRREIEAMRRCKHKNIARLLSVDSYRYGGQVYLTMTEEFLSGGTLADKGSLAPGKCLEIGAQLIDALSHIAKLNLVHRDIKPANIMFRSDVSTPVITDFGVVRDLNESSITPTWAPRGPGTPFFASPEQLNNEKDLTDWRTDQFALGVVLAHSDRDVVERVAAREKPAGWFGQRARGAGLPALEKMISPWPVGRYRKPELLRQEWDRQKG
jgi:serine/threonine protein kinase